MAEERPTSPKLDNQLSHSINSVFNVWSQHLFSSLDNSSNQVCLSI